MIPKNLSVVQGDITQMEADYLVTLANPYGDWEGGVDRALYSQYGEAYHDGLREVFKEGDFENGDIVVIYRNNAPYKGVMFICDDFNAPLPLSELVERMLEAGKALEAKNLLVPVFRSGAALRLFKRFQVEAELVVALREQLPNYPGQVTLVIYNDPEQEFRLRNFFGE